MDSEQKLQLLVGPSVERGGGRGCCPEDPGLCVCTPEKIEQAFNAFDCVEVDKDFSRAGGIYCYKDGERTELQLCS